MFMFIFGLSKKKKKYKKLKLTKLGFHITRNSSLVSSSIVLHVTRVYQAQVLCGIFFNKKNPHAQAFL